MQNAASENSDEEESRLGTWLDLMGSDLRLKITSRDLSIQDPEPCDVGDAVIIEFTAKTASSSEDENGTIFQKVDNWLIVIGDKDVTPALEMGIRFMQEGETGFIFSKSKYAYGSAKRIQGKYILPSDTDVSYQVRIQKLIKSNQVLSNPKCQVEVAHGKKVIANDTYQFEWSDGYSKSKVLNMYKKAGDAMSNLLNEKEIEESVKEKARELLIECLNNIAAVYLRAKEYGKAKEAATRVIVIDPNNMKALLRAARAAIYDPAGTYEESKAAIAAAEIVDPKNRDLLNLKVELQKKIKDYKKRNRQMLSKMSKGINNVNQKPEKMPPASDKKDETLRAANDSEINASSKETSGWLKIFMQVLQFVIVPLCAFYILMSLKVR